jgi:hypothetical protein
LVIVALPAVEKALNSVSPPNRLVIVALPAVGASVPKGSPKLVVPK